MTGDCGLCQIAAQSAELVCCWLGYLSDIPVSKDCAPLLLRAGSSHELSQQEGHLLEQSVQAILDDYRSQHVTAAKHRCMVCHGWCTTCACGPLSNMLLLWEHAVNISWHEQ